MKFKNKLIKIIVNILLFFISIFVIYNHQLNYKYITEWDSNYLELNKLNVNFLKLNKLIFFWNEALWATVLEHSLPININKSIW